MDKEQELAAFIAIKDELLSMLGPLDEEGMNRVPFPGSWTAGQLGEHLLKSFAAIDLSKVRIAPLQRPVDGKFPQMDAVFLDFQMKIQSADFILPGREGISGRSLMDGLRKTTDAIAAYAREHDLSFTCQDFEVLGFGDLTAQEWIHFRIPAPGKKRLGECNNSVRCVVKGYGNLT